MLNLILIVILVVIIGLIFIVYRTDKFSNQRKYNGICAFDLDGTITCGIEQASRAIKNCKDRGYKIAIVTARPTKWYSDLKLNELGLSEEDFVDDFYHGENFVCSFTDRECFERNIADTKLKHLESLAQKYGVPKENIIFFDDQHYNITKAKEEGFTVIYANHKECGLPVDVHMMF